MDVVISKLITDGGFPAALVIAVYLLRPLLKVYLDQQIEQLKRIGDLVAALDQAVVALGGRMDRVEAKVESLVEATNAAA